MRLMIKPPFPEVDNDRLPLMFERNLQARRMSSKEVGHRDATISSSIPGIFSLLASSSYAVNGQSTMNKTGPNADQGPSGGMMTLTRNRQQHYSREHPVMLPPEIRNGNNTITAKQQGLLKDTLLRGLPLSQQHKRSINNDSVITHHQRFLPAMSACQGHSSISPPGTTNISWNGVAFSAQQQQQDPLAMAEWHRQQANDWSHVATSLSQETNCTMLQQKKDLPGPLTGILTTTGSDHQQLSPRITTAHAASPGLRGQHPPKMFQDDPAAESTAVIPGEATCPPGTGALSSTARSVFEISPARGDHKREQRIDDEHDGPSRRKGNSHGTLRLIRPMDVITHKGRGPEEYHLGNLLYRQLIDENQHDYMKMGNSRSSIIMNIVRTIEDYGGWIVEPTEPGAKYGLHLATDKVRKKISDDLKRHVRRRREARLSEVEARKEAIREAIQWKHEQDRLKQLRKEQKESGSQRVNYQQNTQSIIRQAVIEWKKEQDKQQEQNERRIHNDQPKSIKPRRKKKQQKKRNKTENQEFNNNGEIGSRSGGDPM